MTITVTQYAKRLLQLDDILILTHSHPDGDTAGTGVALLCALTALGKNAALACTDKLPDHIAFIENYAPSGKCFFGTDFEGIFAPKSVVSVDIASMALVGSALSDYASKITLALDHHDVNSLEVPELFVEPGSSSAGETLYFALCELEKLAGKKLICKNTACALYSAIASDSGNFKYSCTSGRTMRAAGELIELGADNGDISRRLFDIRSFNSFRAEALCTANTTFHFDGKLAFSYTDKALNEQHGLEESDLETCVQLLRMIKGVEAGIFAKEKTGDDGVVKFRISMRSNEYADVAKICAQFGGGGHKKAAGCTVEGTVEQVKQKLLDAFSEVL